MFTTTLTNLIFTFIGHNFFSRSFITNMFRFILCSYPLKHLVQNLWLCSVLHVYNFVKFVHICLIIIVVLGAFIIPSFVMALIISHNNDMI